MYEVMFLYWNPSFKRPFWVLLDDIVRKYRKRDLKIIKEDTQELERLLVLLEVHKELIDSYLQNDSKKSREIIQQDRFAMNLRPFISRTAESIRQFPEFTAIDILEWTLLKSLIKYGLIESGVD